MAARDRNHAATSQGVAPVTREEAVERIKELRRVIDYRLLMGYQGLETEHLYDELAEVSRQHPDITLAEVS